MNVFVCPNCGHSHPLFGSDGAQKLSLELGIEILGENDKRFWGYYLSHVGDVPLDIRIRQSCDHGSPIALSPPEENNSIATTYTDISERVMQRIQTV